MAAIVDVLYLGQEELEVLKNQYPACVVINLTNTPHLMQRYRLIIPDLDEDEYYEFLVESCLANSSSKFIARIQSDELFASKMKARLAGLINAGKGEGAQDGGGKGEGAQDGGGKGEGAQDGGGIEESTGDGSV